MGLFASFFVADEQLIHQPLPIRVVQDMMKNIGDQLLSSLIVLDVCLVVSQEIFDRFWVLTTSPVEFPC